jgi:hypothetical protein
MKRLVLILTLAASAQAQSSVTWSLPSTPSPAPNQNGGFISLTNSFDTLSNTTVAYVQSQMSGTMSVTNGSPNVTWVSGDKFSVLWHYPNYIRLGSPGSNWTIASGTYPGSCTAGVPLSCTTLVLSANWTGATGTISYLASPQGTHIYSDAIAFYCAGNSCGGGLTANTWQWGPRWGSLDDECVTSTTGYSLPTMRQNAGVFSLDTTRHRLYLGTGVNNSCHIGSITTNGTSTVTVAVSSGHQFVQAAGMWTGLTAAFPNGASPTTTCTITSVATEASMTVGSCSSGFPSGITTVQIIAPDLPATATNANLVWDFWYLALTSTPPSTPSAFTALSMGAVNLNFVEYNLGTLAYDPDDDGFLLYGSSGIAGTGHNTWVFCSADSPGSGTLTARQTAMGCVATNTWGEVLLSGSPISHPPGVFTPGLVYDAVHHRFWQFGGASSYSIGHVQTDPWQYCPTSADSCGTAQTWTAMSSTSQPPAASTTSWIYPPPIVLDTSAGTLIFHLSDTPADYSCTLGTSPCAWVTVTSSGTSPSSSIATSYDSSRNTIVAIPQGSGTNLWLGALSGGAVAPTLGTCGSGSTTVCPSGLYGVYYSQTINLTAGSAPITWSITSGSLPTGLMLDSTTGVISGTPMTTGTPSFTAQASNSAGNASATLSLTVSAALGHSTYNCLDFDGDGYGVGLGCLGPDADDTDATVHTAAQVLTKWGSFAAFWTHMGWTPSAVLYVDGGSGSCTAVTSPFTYSSGTACGTVDAAVTAMGVGQAVVMRAGTVTRTTAIALKPGTLSGGSCTVYNYYLAYPGEQPDFEWNTSVNGTGVSGSQSCMIVDGWKLYQQCLANASCGGGGYGFPNSGTIHGNTYSHIDVGGFTDNFHPQFNHFNTQIVSSYIHDAYPGGDFGHDIYMGSDCPGGITGSPCTSGVESQGSIIAGNIISNGFQTCIHLNGPMTGLLVDSNLVYGCGNGFNFQSGVNHSTIQNNVIHTSAVATFEFDDYSSTGTESDNPWQCNSENFNLVLNNTIFMDGQVYASNGMSHDSGWPSIEVADFAPSGGTTCQHAGITPDMGHNTYANNILAHSCGTNCVSYAGPVLRYLAYTNPTATAWLDSDTYTNNIFNNFDTSTLIIDPLGNNSPQNCSWFTDTSNAPLASGTLCASNPIFVAANPQWNLLPANWNLAVRSTSPAAGAGLAADAPIYDATGAVRSNTAPTVGAYEIAGSAPSSGGSLIFGNVTIKGNVTVH